MRRIFLVAAFLLAASLLFHQTALAAGEDSPEPKTQARTSVLCLPGVYLDNPGDCSPVGPSTYLTQMAEKGITFPPRPLNYSRPDISLTAIDVRYGLVRTHNAPVYGSVEDALKGNKSRAIRVIDSPFSYISYAEDTVVDGKRFYMIEPGAWMTANDISRIGAIPMFQGLTFSVTPSNAFGWVLTYLSPGPVESKRSPGWEQKDYTGRVYNQHEIVQVYTAETVQGEEWYLIGPDEWLHGNVVGRVLPNPTPPKGMTGDRWIEVNLYEQTLAVYNNRQLVFATLIASGLEPFWTRPGLFQIKQKVTTTPMRGSFEADRSDAYYLEDVPWTMYFDEARALHGAYWRTQLGFAQSHGCVNLSVGDSRWLFDWAQEGDWVYVWDPSGKTPVDPSLYSAGGA